MFENPRRGRQERNFKTNISKILDLNSSSEQIFFRKLLLGGPGKSWNLEELRSSIIHTVVQFNFLCQLLCTFDLSKSVSSTPKVTLEKEKKKVETARRKKEGEEK